MLMNVARLEEIISSVSGALTKHDEPTLVTAASSLTDDELARIMTEASRGRAEFDAILTAAAGVAAKRSERALGQAGLAQRNGHRDTVRFVQTLTGSSRGEAARQVRLGEAMGEADAADRVLTAAAPEPGAPEAEPSDASQPSASPATFLPWKHPITRAVEEGTLSSAAGDAIARGLGEPTETCDAETLREAASTLVTEARDMHVDETFRAAKRLRDDVDPEGVRARWQRRYENRSWTMRRNADGQLTAHIVFDDEAGVFTTQLLDIALSPRRGGPRFIAEKDREWAKQVLDDPRTNEQLAFDTILDVLRCGAECDASSTFRTHRPAVRVLVTHDREAVSGVADGIGHLEGTDDAVPLAVIETHLCDAGSMDLTVDCKGNPLDLGREQRHFSARQRSVLRARDGGCLWPGCDSPAWATEAHHINPWYAEHGRTDIADGVLLCRFHHLLLHNKGWRIIRETDASGTRYRLVPPMDVDSDRVPIDLHSKSPGWEHLRRRTEKPSPSRIATGTSSATSSPASSMASSMASTTETLPTPSRRSRSDAAAVRSTTVAPPKSAPRAAWPVRSMQGLPSTNASMTAGPRGHHSPPMPESRRPGQRHVPAEARVRSSSRIWPSSRARTSSRVRPLDTERPS